MAGDENFCTHPAHLIERLQVAYPQPRLVASTVLSNAVEDGWPPEAIWEDVVSDLDTFKDWLAICNAKARYCRTLDTKDWDGFGEIFTEDCELDVSDSGGPPPIRGRDAAIASVQAAILTAKTAHQVHLPEITINGDEAYAVWPMQDRVVWGPDRSLTGYGHYHERWVRQNGEWKIAALKLTRLHMDFQFAGPAD